MTSKKVKRTVFGVIALATVVAISLILWSSAEAGNSNTKTTSDVIWTFAANPVGSSTLVRNAGGLHADFSTSGLAPGQAMTLWFIVFNNPEACEAGPFVCGPEDMGADAPAQGDFLLASGNVIGDDGDATFGGSLKAGDVGGSGLAEFPGGCLPGLPDCGGPIGLVNLDGALVVLAVHSHGPAQTGQVLKEQISSYLGGCEIFTGTLPGGFSANAGELPVNDGECATIQVSPHAPAP